MVSSDKLAIAILLSVIALGILCGLMFHYLNKKNFFSELTRSNPGKSFSVLLAAAMSILFYVCGGGATPTIYGLMNMGMNKAAVLAFFIVGPATRI